MLNLTENSLHVLKERYLRQDEKGNVIETPEQLFERVSNSICDTPELKERILKRLINLDFLPNSPTLMNAGTNMSQLSACFAIEIKDSLISIFNGVKHTALIFQTGGGVGATFEHIRPKGTRVKSTQGVASGPISFMANYNTVTEAIKQGGKRRGAFMAILNVSHPDIFEFINCKDKGNTLSNMNISVSVTNEFMNAVEKDLDWSLHFNNKGDDKVYKILKAKEIFNMIVQHAHYCGDPGLIFIDTVNKDNKGEWMEQTNPCSEQPLLPYESCNLGSIRLSNFVKDGKIDWISLKDCIFDAIEFLDLVIDNNNYSDIILEEIPQIKQKTLETRKIGLGVMAWADALILLNIQYNSNEAYNLAEEIMKFIHDCAYIKDVELAKSKGAFPKFREYYPENDSIPIRNANLTTIAPTGTISVIADCSSGIEPIYAVVYKRNLKDTIGKDLIEINPIFLRIAKERGFYSDVLIERISNNHGSIQNMVEVPEDIKKIFVTAHDVLFTEHIKMQASFQKYTQSGISKTLNMSNSATIDDVYNAYILAWKSGCKGITVYRDGCKEHQVLSLSNEVPSLMSAPLPRRRYKDHVAIIREIESACGVTYNGISFDIYGQMEDFPINSGKGGCIASQEAIGRSVSTMLRNKISPEIIIKQYHRVKCNACLTKDEFYVKDEDKHTKFIGIYSCADGISRHMRDYYDTDIEKELIQLQKKVHAKFNVENVNDNLFEDTINSYKNIKNESIKRCKECGSINIDNTKCNTCMDCGASKCI